MIGRLPRIVSAYLAASFASGYALSLGLLFMASVGQLLEGRWMHARVFVALALYYLGLFGVFASLLIVCLAFVPAVVAIGVAEAARLRSAILYGVAGAISAIAGCGIFLREVGDEVLWIPGFEPTLTTDRALVKVALVLVAGSSGLIGGLTYWSMEGKSAGGWRAPRRAKS